MEDTLDTNGSDLLFVEHKELIDRIATSDDATVEEFGSTFDIYDANSPGTSSLGVYLVVRYPYIFLRRRPLRSWMRAMGELVHANATFRNVFHEQFADHAVYTRQEAVETLVKIPELHEMMLRAMLMFKGFSGARHWETTASGHLVTGQQGASNVILHHLREGGVRDIRLLLSGPDDGFDGSGLIKTVTPTTIRAVASVCATRAPELFLYRHWRLHLSEAWREEMCRRIAQDANYWLTREQERELVESKSFLPPKARERFESIWFPSA